MAIKKEKTWNAARNTYWVFVFFVFLACAYLWYLLLSHHFEVEYVYAYSSSDLPVFYLISCFWAGQEGTFLLWLFGGAGLGLFLIKEAKSHPGYVMAFYLLAQIFLLILLLKRSPFTLLGEFPPEGRGLNPLLQDFWMVIHPPIVFLGYAALAIPFCYSASALIQNRFEEWVKSVFPWAVFSCLSLGVGIFIGGYWAYKVLGWGGYWGWDPVENASLVPWLLSIALVHGLLLEKIKGSLRRTNLVLALLGFPLVLYATFLTRSGILGEFSVHSFSDLGINTYLVIFLLLFTFLSLGLFVFRAKTIHPAVAIKNLLSGEFFISLAITFLLVSAVLILLGTSAPIITALFGPASNVSLAYYVNTQLPLGIILALLLGVTPFLGWKGSGLKELKRSLSFPLTATLGLTILAFLFGVTSPIYLILVLFSCLVLLTNAMLLLKKIKSGWRLIGGYVAHFGIGLMLIGIITSSGYSRSTVVNLPEGQTQDAFGYQFTYMGTQGDDTSNQKNALLIRVEKGDKIFMARPRLYYSEYNQNYMRTPYIKINLLYDLYLAPLEHRGGKEGGNSFDLGPGETKQIGGYSIKFIGFDRSSHGMEGVIRVGAKLEVTHGAETVIVIPAMVMNGIEVDTSQNRVSLPGGGEDRLVLNKINADEETVTLSLLSSETEPSGNLLVLEVSQKPLINTLWLGTVLVLTGLIISSGRRMKDAQNSSSQPLSGK